MLFLKPVFCSNYLFSNAEVEVHEPKTLEYFFFALCQIVFFLLKRTVLKIDFEVGFLVLV
jgi:hypothetical protein